jgi:autotransporter-associated beta strand protein
MGLAAGNLTLSGSVSLAQGGTAERDFYCYKNLTLSGPVSGGLLSGLRLTAGNLYLQGANTFTNNVTFSGAGTLLNINADAALGDAANGVTFSNSATMQAGAASISLAATRTINIAASQTATFDVPTSDTLTVAGAITNTGALTKTSPGTLVLSGVNTYSGSTTISAGTLTLSGNRTAATGTMQVSAGTLNIQNGNFSFEANKLFVGVGGTATVNHSAGVTSFNAGLQLLVGNSGCAGLTETYNFSGGTLTGVSGGTFGVLLGVNAGTVGSPVTANFNLSGTATLNMGGSSLRIGRSDTTQTYQNGTFSQTGGAATFGTMALGGAASGTTYANATLNLTGGTFTNTSFTLLAAGDNNTANITIGGTADVTLPAFPTARGSGSTAAITFDGGTLRPYAASTTYLQGLTSASLTANGANFNVASGNDITVAQSLQNASGQTGTLAKAGAGTLTLSGNNSYTGPTTISAGTLSIATIANGGGNSPLGASTSGAANLVFAGGTLSYGGATASCDRSFNINAATTATISVPTGAANLTLTGNAPTTTGYLKKIGAGTLTLNPSSGNYSVGALSADGGLLTLNSGTFNATGTDPASAGYLIGAGARSGTLVVDGGSLNVTNAGTANRLSVGANFGTGTMNIISGVVNATSFFIGHNGFGTVTQSGGNVTVGTVAHWATGSWASTATNTITGGTLTAQRIYNYSTTPTNYFTLILNGGVLKTAASTTNLLDNGGLGGPEMAVQLGSTGATIDTSLSSATIERPLDDLSGQVGQLTKIGANILTLANNNTYTGTTTVSNGTLLVNGAISTGAVAVMSGATLGGSGIIGGAVTVESGGTLQSGSGGTNIATLIINNALTNAAGSTTFMKIDQASSTNDVVAGLTAVSFDGTLTVTNLGGTFVGGESYQLFSAGSYNGNFTATNLPVITPLNWNWNPTNGTLSVVSGTATTPTNITYSVSGSTLTLTWPGSHLGWFAQSNSVNLEDTNYWFNISGSETATNLVITMDPTLTNVFYRLRMP